MTSEATRAPARCGHGYSWGAHLCPYACDASSAKTSRRQHIVKRSPVDQSRKGGKRRSA